MTLLHACDESLINSTVHGTVLVQRHVEGYPKYISDCPIPTNTATLDCSCFPSATTKLPNDAATKAWWTQYDGQRTTTGKCQGDDVIVAHTNHSDIASLGTWFLSVYHGTYHGKRTWERYPRGRAAWRFSFATGHIVSTNRPKNSILADLPVVTTEISRVQHHFSSASCYHSEPNPRPGHYWWELNWSRDAKVAQIFLGLLQVSPAERRGKTEWECLKSRAWMVSNASRWDERGDDAHSQNGGLIF